MIILSKRSTKLAKYPSELEVWYVLPGIHRELSKYLKTEVGLRQKAIAEILELSPAAVSYYIRNERAKEIFFPEEINNRIYLSAQKIYENPSSYFGEVHTILNLIRETGALCQIHKEKGRMRNNCTVCMDGIQES